MYFICTQVAQKQFCRIQTSQHTLKCSKTCIVTDYLSLQGLFLGNWVRISEQIENPSNKWWFKHTWERERERERHGENLFTRSQTITALAIVNGSEHDYFKSLSTTLNSQLLTLLSGFSLKLVFFLLKESAKINNHWGANYVYNRRYLAKLQFKICINEVYRFSFLYERIDYVAYATFSAALLSFYCSCNYFWMLFCSLGKETLYNVKHVWVATCENPSYITVFEFWKFE